MRNNASPLNKVGGISQQLGRTITNRAESMNDKNQINGVVTRLMWFQRHIFKLK